MIFAFTDEQRELAATLRRFLQDKSPSSEVRRLMQTERNPQRISTVCKPAKVRLMGDRRIDVPAGVPNALDGRIQVRDCEEHIDLRPRIVAVQADADTRTLKPAA